MPGLQLKGTISECLQEKRTKMREGLGMWGIIYLC